MVNLIEGYKFGEIKINDRKYSSDVIVYLNRVNDSWWRKEGHSVCLEDIKKILDYKPDIIIFGTGNSGMMEVLKDVRSNLKGKGIEVIVLPTLEACEEYNKYVKENKRVVGAFHLTC